MTSKSKKINNTIVYLAVCLLFSACSTVPEQADTAVEIVNIEAESCNILGKKSLDSEAYQEIRKHVIRINHDGLVLPPNVDKNEFISYLEEDPVTPNVFEQQFNEIITAAEQHAEAHATGQTGKRNTVKLLIYVHGGLNFFIDTDKRVSRLAKFIEDDGDNWHYPIFISWPSSPFGTYGEHLTSIRSGNKVGTLNGLLTSPLVLMTDMMQLGDIVSSVYSQVDRVITEIAHNTNLDEQKVPKIWRHARANYEFAMEQQDCTDSGVNPRIYWSRYHYPPTASADFFSDYIGRHTAKSLTFPIRATLGTIYNGAIVKSAWQNMKRRTKNIFYPPQSFVAGGLDNYVAGGLFFEKLLNYIDENKERYDYQITLIGHSMGTMVLNQTFKKYRVQWLASGALKNIVYMAAAASIHDTMDSVFPIIKDINQQASQPVWFYNLTLNRLAEISETTVNSLLPNGSLLINIDEHLETPATPLDRTMGQEANVLAVLPVLAERLGDAAKYVELKSFDRYYQYGPDKHGSFNDMPYWRQAFWSVGGKTETPWCNGQNCFFNGYPKDWCELEAKKLIQTKIEPYAQNLQTGSIESPIISLP